MLKQEQKDEDLDLVKNYMSYVSYYFRQFNVGCKTCNSKTEKQFHPIYNKLWDLIHSLPFLLKEDIGNNNRLRNSVISFYNKFKFLPCEICKKHYKLYVINNPINKLKNNVDLQNWTIDLHNEVNERTHKRKYFYSNVKNRYNGFVFKI